MSFRVIPNFKVKNVEGVVAFLKYVVVDLNLGWDFHPDDDFAAFVDQETGKPLFSEEDADELNELIDKCFDICAKQHKDIYHLTLQEQLKLD